MCPLEEGQLPEWQEGYGLDGQKLLLSLCNLYLKIENVDEWEACHHIITWCKENSFPYCTQVINVAEYDYAQLQDVDHWDFMVNVLNGCEFKLDKITADLKRLYEDTEILLHFYNVKNNLESFRALPQNKRIQEYADIASLTEMQLLYKLDSFLSELPKFPLKLTLDDVGEMKILPGFTSVFDAAYYALARFVATQPEVPTKKDGGKTPLGICESCGKIFFKNGLDFNKSACSVKKLLCKHMRMTCTEEENVSAVFKCDGKSFAGLFNRIKLFSSYFVKDT